MKQRSRLLTGLLIIAAVSSVAYSSRAAEDYYTGEPVYELRPGSGKDKEFGHIGPTGILNGAVEIAEGARNAPLSVHVKH